MPYRFLPTLLLHACTCVLAPLFAQISATVVDARTQDPLPFVGVYLQSDNSVGLLADDGGRFLIGGSVALAESDTLIFQQLGYRTLRLAVSDLRAMTVVPLTSAAIELTAVTVKPEDYLRRVFKEAYAAIPRNYLPQKKIYLPVLYREYNTQNGRLVERIAANGYIRDRAYRHGGQPFDIYLTSLERTEDGRQLPIQIRDWHDNGINSMNGLNNSVRSRYFAFFLWGEMPDSLFKYTVLRDMGTYVDGRDTLQRIGYDLRSGPLYYDEEGVSGTAGELIINLRDRAFVKIVAGNPGNAYAKQFTSLTYQRIGKQYYPKIFHDSGGITFNDKQDYLFTVQQLVYLPERSLSDKPERADRGRKLPRGARLRDYPNFSTESADLFDGYSFDHLLPKIMQQDTTWRKEVGKLDE